MPRRRQRRRAGGRADLNASSYRHERQQLASSATSCHRDAALMSDDIKTVGVVGAGTMGNGIAQVFAQAASSVRLVDVAQPMLERARGDDREEPRQVRREGQADRRRPRRGARPALDRDRRSTRSPTPTTSSRRSSRTSRPSATLFAQPRRAHAARRRSSPRTRRRSRSPSLGAATKRPDQVLGMHFMNPVPLMTLVELIRGQATSDDVDADRGRVCARRSARRRSRRPTIPASSPTAS